MPRFHFYTSSILATLLLCACTGYHPIAVEVRDGMTDRPMAGARVEADYMLGLMPTDLIGLDTAPKPTEAVTDAKGRCVGQ